MNAPYNAIRSVFVKKIGGSSLFYLVAAIFYIAIAITLKASFPNGGGSIAINHKAIDIEKAVEKMPGFEGTAKITDNTDFGTTCKNMGILNAGNGNSIIISCDVGDGSAAWNSGLLNGTRLNIPYNAIYVPLNSGEPAANWTLAPENFGFAQSQAKKIEIPNGSVYFNSVQK